jgi:hypothetical protein
MNTAVRYRAETSYSNLFTGVPSRYRLVEKLGRFLCAGSIAMRTAVRE